MQFRLLDLFELMVGAPNFPEGFRSGYELRDFHACRARFPLSEQERETISAMRGKLAPLLADCGFSEAAAECGMDPARTANGRPNVDLIVNEVMRRLKQHGREPLVASGRQGGFPHPGVMKSAVCDFDAGFILQAPILPPQGLQRVARPDFKTILAYPRRRDTLPVACEPIGIAGALC